MRTLSYFILILLSIVVLYLFAPKVMAQPAPDEAAIVSAGDACNEPGHLRAVPNVNKSTNPPTIERWFPGWEACEAIMPAYNDTRKKRAEAAKVKADQDKLDAVNALAGQIKGKK